MMWERFSTSGLAGAYLDELLATGLDAQMEFRPRRATDPFPFLVSLADDSEGEMFLSRACRTADRSSTQPDHEAGMPGGGGGRNRLRAPYFIV
jgi:hypothetical protein